MWDMPVLWGGQPVTLEEAEPRLINHTTAPLPRLLPAILWPCDGRWSLWTDGLKRFLTKQN